MDRQTDGRTDGQNYDSQDRASIAASRGKIFVRVLVRGRKPVISQRTSGDPY